MMENTDYSQFAGSPAMPYLNELARQYADFTQAFGWNYPSLPNYLELLSGTDEGLSQDCDITQPGCGNFTNPTLVDQLEAKGISWNAYYQGDAFGCDQSDGSGNYPYWHNSFRYFADFASQCSHISNFTDLLSNLSSPQTAAFQWVVPDLVNSGGDNGTMSSGDSWLAGELPQIMDSSWYREGGQIVILFDTGYQDSGGNGGASGGQIPMVVVSGHAAGTGAVSTPVNTAGVLHSIESAYGLSYLGDAADPANGNLGDALVAGRPVGPSLQPSETGAVLDVTQALGSGPGEQGSAQNAQGQNAQGQSAQGSEGVQGIPGTLALNGIAPVSSGPFSAGAQGGPGGGSGPPSQSSLIKVGENTRGQGVVVSPQAGSVAVPNTSNLESVSCETDSQCYAVGLGPSDDDEAVLVSIQSGRPVSTTPLPAFIGLYGISCPAATTCYAVGYDNADDADAVTTITGGQASAPVEVQGGGEWLNAISCPTATTCDAVGLVNYAPSVVPIANGTPGAPVTIPDAWYVNGIDCPTASNCVVVGENATEQGIVDTVTGGQPATPQVVSGAEYLYGVACQSSDDCALTGSATSGSDGYSDGLVVALTGGVAHGAEPLGGTNGFGQVACSGGSPEAGAAQQNGAQHCFAVGADFRSPLDQ